MAHRMFKMTLIGVLVAVGAGCSQNDSPYTPPGNTSLSDGIANADANGEATTFDPVSMSVDLTLLVGADLTADPVAIRDGDTVQTVLARLDD